MFRSQTDEQLAARHDPEPWIAGDNGWSDRFATEADVKHARKVLTRLAALA